MRFTLPVGKIEPGETSLQALAKELREELGTRSAFPWIFHVVCCAARIEALA